MLTLNDEVKNAFILLFDRSFIPTLEIIKNINPDEIKDAYRKKAFEFHPDRALLLGKNKNELTENFKEINVAYGTLRSFLKENRFYFPGINSAWKKTNYQKTAEGKKYYHNKTSWNTKTEKDTAKEKKPEQKNNTGGKKQQSGRLNLPNAELLIGQFLFWCGIISWKTLIEAIVWQKNQRPLFGEIAKNWNILSEDEIRRIIAEKNSKDRIGDYAFQKGYISQFEHLAILGRQRNLQRPIGEYFVDNGHISLETMDSLASEHRRHNIKVRFGVDLTL